MTPTEPLYVNYSRYKVDPKGVRLEAAGREIVVLDDETGAHKMYIPGRKPVDPSVA